MGYADGTADHIGYGKNFEDLIGRYAQFMAFPQVVFDAVIATQYHGSNQTKHLLGGYVKRPFLVGLVIQTPESFDYFVVVGKYALIHSGAVVIKFFY
jgi:hypothetical protein